MFPFIMPSSLNPAHSRDHLGRHFVTEYPECHAGGGSDFCANHPGYTLWTYMKMFGRVNAKFIEEKQTLGLLRRR